MMGPPMDRRVEAVAGRPVAGWRYPDPPSRVTVFNGWTFVYATLPIYGPDNQYLTDSGSPRHLIYAKDQSLRAGGSSLPSFAPPTGAFTYEGLPEDGVTAGLGARFNLTSPWASGPASIAVYDHPLTPEQAVEIARRLAASI